MATYIPVTEAAQHFDPPISRQRVHLFIRTGRVDAITVPTKGEKRQRWLVRVNDDGTITVRPGKSINGRPPQK